MHKNLLSHRGLVCALAAVLAVAAPGTPQLHAAARLSNAALLAAQLPAGETLESAPLKDVSAAVRSAVGKRPAAASEIVRLAIQAKARRRRNIACGVVSDLVTAGVSSAPGRAREISEMAMAIAPDCTDAIAQAVQNPSTGTTGTIGNTPTTGAAVPGSTTGETTGVGNNGGTTATPNAGDFGAGFGPGFPGSPGFSGSSPSGGFALPPATTPAVTQ